MVAGERRPSRARGSPVQPRLGPRAPRPRLLFHARLVRLLGEVAVRARGARGARGEVAVGARRARVVARGGPGLGEAAHGAERGGRARPVGEGRRVRVLGERAEQRGLAAVAEARPAGLEELRDVGPARARARACLLYTSPSPRD